VLETDLVEEVLKIDNFFVLGNLFSWLLSRLGGVLKKELDWVLEHSLNILEQLLLVLKLIEIVEISKLLERLHFHHLVFVLDRLDS